MKLAALTYDPLDEAFGPVPKPRGRPRRRAEETTVVSFNVAHSIVKLGHARAEANRGLLTRYLTACYALFIELPVRDIELAVEAFERRRGVTIEALTARTLQHARKTEPKRPTRLRLVGPRPRR